MATFWRDNGVLSASKSDAVELVEMCDWSPLSFGVASGTASAFASFARLRSSAAFNFTTCASLRRRHVGAVAKSAT